MKKKIAILFVIISVFTLSMPHNVRAIEYGMLGGKPANPDPKIENSGAWFIYDLKAGESKQDAITVMNLFDSPLDVVVYPADSTNSSNGGFALKQMTESKDEVGSWVKFYTTNPPDAFAGLFQQHNENIVEFCALSQADLQQEYGKSIITSDQFSELGQWCQGTNLVERQFKPKENINIPFVISIPQSADAGEHTGGILIQKKLTDDQAGPNAGSTVKLTTRVGVRIYETVPGDIIKKLSLDDFKVLKNFSEFSFSDWFGEKKPREYLVQSNVSNSGNVSVEHENNVIITNLLFGKDPQVIDRKFQVLKKDKFISNMSWQKPLFGYYSFQAQIKYQGSNGEETLLSAPVKIWIMPWRELTLGLVLIGVLMGIYAGWKHYYKKKYGGIGWTTYKVKKTDTIAKIAEKYTVDWKVLVKTNKLKPPYMLEAGMSILVPQADGNGQIAIKEEIASRAEAAAKTRASKKKVEEVVITAPEKKTATFNKKYLLWSGIFVLLIVIIIVTIVVLKKIRLMDAAPQPSISSIVESSAGQTVAPIENQTAKAVETPVKKETGDVAILNGGAAAGTAGKLSDFLKEKGFEQIVTKNAELDTHRGVVVYYQDEYEPFADKIMEVLGAKYKDAKLQIAQDDEQRSAAVVITLGK